MSLVQVCMYVCVTSTPVKMKSISVAPRGVLLPLSSHTPLLTDNHSPDFCPPGSVLAFHINGARLYALFGFCFFHST